MDGTDYRLLFTKLQTITRKWNHKHKHAHNLLHALLQFKHRTTLLNQNAHRQRPEALRPLENFQHATQALHRKHVKGMENIICALKDALRDFATLHADMAQLRQTFKERVGQNQESREVGPEQVIVGAGRGIAAQSMLIPGPEYFMDWLTVADKLFKRELDEKMDSINAISYEMPVDNLSHMVEFWASQPVARGPVLDQLDLFVDSFSIPESESFG